MSKEEDLECRGWKQNRDINSVFLRTQAMDRKMNAVCLDKFDGAFLLVDQTNKTLLLRIWPM
jgi:mevalonate pyrophosphate decarboxylase